MKLLTDPFVVRAALVFVAAVIAFGFGVWMMRRMRKGLNESTASAPARNENTFALEAYQGVIQRMKSQEQELQRLRQEATDRASASESLSAAILSNLASGVLLFDAAGTVRQANRAARDLLGYASIAHLHARDVFRGVKPSSEFGAPATSLPQAIEQCVRSGEGVSRVVVDYISPGGEARVLAVTVSPVQGGAACLITDLTELSRLSQQLRVQQSMAALGEMSAGIAHEFKNSLTTISGYAQMLAADTQGEVNEFAARIQSEIQGLSRVVTQFLQFARPQEICCESLDVKELLEECARSSGVAITVEIAEGAREISGDPVALRQVFCNLMRNSAEAAPAGMDPAIVARAARHDGSLRVTLQDNGGGIPAEALSKIFIPFFTTKPTGTGLGLALVQRIVTQHGGTISAGNEGLGTVFTLTFPASKEGANGAESG